MRALTLRLIVVIALATPGPALGQYERHYGACPLCEAIRAGDLAGFDWLLRAGADPNQQYLDNDAETPLHFAAINFPDDRQRMIQMASALIAAGADPNVRDVHGAAPLHRAAGKDALELASLLLAAGADPNARTHSIDLVVIHSTPLHAAAWRASADMIDLLLKAGANANAQDCVLTRKETPRADGYGVSIEYSCTEESKRRTPLDIAIEQGNQGAIEVLRRVTNR